MTTGLLRRSFSLSRSFATEASWGIKPSPYGQPLPLSHPHLLGPNDLTPGIPAFEYASRRKALMDRLPSRSAVVSLAAPIKYMSKSILFAIFNSGIYHYRQDSNFLYLTGFQESDTAVVLEKTSDSQGYRMILFTPAQNNHEDTWHGHRTRDDDLVNIFGAHSTQRIDTLSDYLNKSAATLYVDLPSHLHDQIRRNNKRASIFERLRPSSQFDDIDKCLLEKADRKRTDTLRRELDALRSIKSENEVKVMRRSCDIAGRAHAKTMRFAHPGVLEAHLEAHFQYLCLRENASRLSYVPVVGSGANSVIIHHTRNHGVRMDAGCEYAGYASDITRTFPVNGKFSSEQRDLYSAVLSTQKEMIKLCTTQSGANLWTLHHDSVKTLGRELKQVGLDLDTRTLENVYPHNLCHPIGLDLHEDVDKRLPLQPGMVITIEPGVYIPSGHRKIPERFWNNGLQVEDLVLITEKEPVVLSVAAPKEIADVEGACQGALGLEAF
ncbi:peptidase M24 [Flagelloscypha sp. PMI_526]|nr:peptidase M24 [Flagelloscypha sp. PMI_526]